MGEREQAEELARSILIENLPFSTATRRVLIRKGCKTLADAFELPEVGLTRDLGRLGDELFDIKDLYERKPGVFLTRASRFKEIEREPRTGSNDVYVVTADDGKETLLAAIPDVIKSIDEGEKKIVVDPPEWVDE